MNALVGLLVSQRGEENMWGPEHFEVSEFRDGGIVLSCGDEGMETDLVFAASYDGREHPQTSKQREIAEYIVRAVKFYQANDSNERRQEPPERKL